MQVVAPDGNEEGVRSPFAPIIAPLAALIASLVRWWLQGSGNMFTALDKRYYVPDPDLGWVISNDHPIWLGLEVCAVIAGVVFGCLVGGFLIRKLRATRPRLAKGLWITAWIVGIATLIVPIAAFASGPGTEGSRDTPPTASSVAVEGIAGSLDLPAGRYEIMSHSSNSITANVSAGKETFPAVFSGDIKGSFVGSPKDLTLPLTADANAATASVDTGITPRSNSARDEYLQASKFPRIGFVLEKLVGAKQAKPDEVAFSALGKIDFIGKQIPVTVTGTLRKADAATKARQRIDGDILLVQADFALVIKETALAPDAGDFDGDRIPIHVSLVLRHTGER